MTTRRELLLAALPMKSPAPVGFASSSWRGGESPGRRLSGHAGDPATAAVVKADSIWRVASISKLAQALVALRLVEQGRLDLDAPLDDLLGFALRHPDGQPVTVRQLLSHQSGLHDNGGDGLRIPTAPLSRQVLSPFWGSRRFHYANFNSVVLGTALEGLTGLRYDELMQRELFDPLGIEAAFDPMRLSDAQVERAVTLLRPGRSGWSAQAPGLRQPKVPADYRPGRNCVPLSPQGGMLTSLQGLELLAEAMRVRDPKLLSAQGFALLHAVQWQGDAHAGLFRRWTLGAQAFTDHPGGDRLRPLGSLKGIGHLGEAYGLLGGLVVRQAERDDPGWAMVYLLHGAKEAPGQWSAFQAAEEAVLAPLSADWP